MAPLDEGFKDCSILFPSDSLQMVSEAEKWQSYVQGQP